MPAHIEAACENVSVDMVADQVPCGPDLEKHLEAIRSYEQAGFDELYVQQIGSDHERFFDVYANEILPRFHAGEPASPVLSPAR